MAGLRSRLELRSPRARTAASGRPWAAAWGLVLLSVVALAVVSPVVALPLALVAALAAHSLDVPLARNLALAAALASVVLLLFLGAGGDVEGGLVG